jgi:hypothetical protein
MREAAKPGQLAEGVLGRFAVDFVAVHSERGEWEVYAIEINLRKGWDDAPFLTLQFLTDGTCDATSGAFVTPRGESSASWRPTISSRRTTAFTHDHLFDLAVRYGLHFDQARQRHGVPHDERPRRARPGRSTAVENTHEEADAL